MITARIVGLPEALLKIAKLAVAMELGGEVGRQKGAERIAARARENVAVRSGRTRDSIRVEDGNVIADGAARYLEFGLHPGGGMPAEPFLGPAVETESPGVVEDVGAAVRIAVVRV